MVKLDGEYYTKVNKLRETYDPSGAATLRRLNSIKNEVKQGGIAFCDLIESDLTFVGDTVCFAASGVVVAGKKIIQQEPPEWAKKRVDDGFTAVKNDAKQTVDGTWTLLTNPKSVYDGIVKIVEEKGIMYVVVYGGTQGCIGASTLGAVKELAGPKIGMLATAANHKACKKVPVLLTVEGKVVKVIGTVQVTKNGIKIAGKSKIAKVIQPFKILEEDIVSFTKNRKGIKIGTVAEEGTEVVIKSLDDLKKIGIHSADDLVKHGITSFKQLKKLGIKSADDLAELGIKSAEDLKKLGITKAEQLKKLGITSAEDLKKLGVKIENGKIKKINYTGVGVTGQGIPIERVDSNVLKKIHPDSKAAYGYSPNEGTAYSKYDFTDIDYVKKNRVIREEYIEQSKKD